MTIPAWEVVKSSSAGYWGSDPGSPGTIVRAVRNGDVGTSGHLSDSAGVDRSFSDTQIAKSRIHSQDILITSSGNYGRVAFVADEPDVLTCATNFVRILRADTSRTTPRYLYYALRTPAFEGVANRLARGATIKNLSVQSALQALQIPLPPLERQQRVTSILDEADAIRAKRRAQLAHLDELPWSLLHEALGETKWKHNKIGNLGSITTGKTPPTTKEGMFGGPIPFVTPGDLESNIASARTVTLEGAESSRTVGPGATLVCCIGATIGKTGRTTERSAFNQQINAIEWGSEIDETFGYFLMKSMSPKIKFAGASTTLPLLPKGRFAELEIPIPPLMVQQAFANKVSAIRAERDRVERALEADEELFAALQHRAFRGEL